MKKLFIKLLILAVLCGGSLLSLHHTKAAGGYAIPVRFSYSATSAPAGSSITVSVHLYYYACTSIAHPDDPTMVIGSATPQPCQAGYSGPVETANSDHVPIVVSVSGSGNSLSSGSFTTDNSGNGHFSLSSSVAEPKTITLTSEYAFTNPMATTVVTFTGVVAPSPAAAPKSTPTAATSAATAAVPATPAPDIKVGNTVVKSGEQPIVSPDKPLVLSGKTVPNGVVTIYVFSEPKKYTVTADKEGNWAYQVAVLPAGNHHIEAEVTDPATGKTSPRAQVLAFHVAKAATTLANADLKRAATTKAAASSSKHPLIISTILVLLVVVTTYLWFFQRAVLLRLLHRQTPTSVDPHQPEHF